ncbi:MAG: DUF4266 domain-containing protein [Myxococcales bacterium]
MIKLVAIFRSRARGRASISSSLVLCTLLVGCVHVQPHEREILARASMDPKTERGEAAFQAHMRESREGATSSAGASGGGCGCN